MGQVCAKHNEFYELECRWCEPEVADYPAVGTHPWHFWAANVIREAYGQPDIGDPNDGHGSLE